MGGCGALLIKPEGIEAWARDFRGQSNGAFQINLWIPDPPPRRDPAAEAKMRDFLGQWGPPVAGEAGDATPPDFAAQCEALIAAGPRAVSSIMGLFPQPYVQRLKERGIAWFATATTLAEALEAQRAGADAVIAQGLEAGGHRGAFDAATRTNDLSRMQAWAGQAAVLARAEPAAVATRRLWGEAEPFLR